MSWEWFNTGAGAASIVGLIVTIGSVISGWNLKRLQADIHASTQLTLTDMRKGFTESQQAIAQTVSHLGDILIAWTNGPISATARPSRPSKP